MKLRYCGLLLILVLGVIGDSSKAQLHSTQDWRDDEPKIVTLYSRAKYKDQFEGYGKSAFSFRYGMRSDVPVRATGNNYELAYGGISWNRDSDWFTVTLVTDDCSRIKDLGALQWSEVFDVPFLAASVMPQGGVKMPRRTETFEESSNGRVTRVVAGHMYVVHSKDSTSDFYTLFRVEKLVPSDEVTISWKLVPSPEL